MLSRIAESLFWIGRYVERADVTSRILDVQTQMLVEDPFVDEETSCRLLLAIMGVEHDGTLDQRALMRLMLLTTATSTLGRRHARGRPRERPPGPRDPVDRDVGGHQHQVAGDHQRPRAGDAHRHGLRWVRERAR